MAELTRVTVRIRQWAIQPAVQAQTNVPAPAAIPETVQPMLKTRAHRIIPIPEPTEPAVQEIAIIPIRTIILAQPAAVQPITIVRTAP